MKTTLVNTRVDAGFQELLKEIQVLREDSNLSDTLRFCFIAGWALTTALDRSKSEKNASLVRLMSEQIHSANRRIAMSRAPDIPELVALDMSRDDGGKQ